MWQVQNISSIALQKMVSLASRGPLGVKPPDYSSGGGVVMAGTSSYPSSHMPNQSSNISSSNQHRHDASGSHVAPHGGYIPPAFHHANNCPQMSLSHHYVPNHHEQVTTTLQPIVIQPLPEPNGQFDAFTQGWKNSFLSPIRWSSINFFFGGG